MTNTVVCANVSVMDRGVLKGGNGFSLDHDGPIKLFLIPADVKVYIKNPFLLIRKTSPCTGSSKFPFLLSEWSFTKYLIHNQRLATLSILLVQYRN